MKFKIESLRTEMRRLAMDYKALAFEMYRRGCPTTPAAVHSWVSGKRTPRLDKMIVVAKVFGRRLQYFFE